ncbi:MAG: hypothetical protein U0797_08775 [Gemmataceae bacterium]
MRDGVPASAWNPANDWSFQGLSSSRDDVRQTEYIPVYEGGTRLSGRTPV